MLLHAVEIVALVVHRARDLVAAAEPAELDAGCLTVPVELEGELAFLGHDAAFWLA